MVEYSKSQSPRTQSFIPVVTPRPTRTGLPSSFSSTNIPLVAPIRRPSISGPSVGEHPVSHVPQASGSSSFRTLRNLLPFGNSGKQQVSYTPTLNNTNGSKNPFSNFGSVRRSMNSDRKTSATFTNQEESEPSPVIAIEATSKDTNVSVPVESSNAVSASEDLISAPPSPIRYDIDADNNTNPAAPSLSPGHTLGDLSTIIEAETSGISKHIPNMDESEDYTYRHAKASSSFGDRRGLSAERDQSPMAILGDSYIDMESGNVSDSSILDLDPSELKSEVRDAMLATDVSKPGDWLNAASGVIVDRTPDSSTPPAEDDKTKSFNLGSLDPDLAALLSPHNINTNSSAVFTKNLAPSPYIPSPSTSPRRFEDSIPRVGSDSYGDQLAPPKSPERSQIFPAAAQSSPARRRSASLSKSSANHRPVSLSSLPRLARSVTTSPYHQGKDVATLGRTSQASSYVDDFGRGASMDHTRRLQPPSPLSANPSTNGHRASQSRLITPARRTASHSIAGGSSRPPLRHLATAGSIGNWDASSLTPSSQASSSTTNTRSSRSRLHNPRSSIDESRNTEGMFVRHRNGSMSLSQPHLEGSVESTSPYQPSLLDSPTRPSSANSARRTPTAEWLGPRTAKAFAAAGLLDHERAAAAASASSTSLGRYGSLRGMPEQDPRIQYGAPSRVAFSEASGSTSSWGRSRSASRTLTMSDAGGALIESPTFSIPRTNSTAPTSISTSPHMTSVNVAMQSMMEKHSVETEALLSALADSQRVAKSMREENTELRSRIQELEGIIFQMRQQWRSVSPQPPSRPLSRTVHNLLSQPKLDNGLPRRPHSQHTFNGFLHPNPETNNVQSREASPNPFKESTPSHRRRFSTTSSNFHLPPSNMSMIMHEVDVGAGRLSSGGFSSPSGSPPSPTLVMPKPSSNLRYTHQHKRSMSSGTSTSPTTANFSFTGSPGSLHLRPEHEMHLGDMASLDLAFAGEDSGEDDAL